jgi:type III pantothenate kinase
MLLTIDIGNTTIKLGVFEGNNLKASWHIATDIDRLADEYAVVLLELLKQKGIAADAVEKVAMCSVVPPLTATFEELLSNYFGISPLVIEAGVKTGVRIRMDNPREVGADRIVNAAAAHNLYGGPVIIVDLGTATTFDAVSADGDYLGGAIAPGMVIAIETLSEKAAMLPRVELTKPAKAIGSNTVSAMQSGILFGYVGLVEGLVSRIKKELGEKTQVVATGGYARLIAAETAIIDAVNTDLTLHGLKLIDSMNRA